MGFWQACEDTWMRKGQSHSFMVVPDDAGLAVAMHMNDGPAAGQKLTMGKRQGHLSPVRIHVPSDVPPS